MELTGCRAANELMQITMRLIAEGLDDESIAKIWGVSSFLSLVLLFYQKEQDFAIMVL